MIAEEAFAILKAVAPGILVLYIEMLSLSGFETYEEIKRSHPGWKYPIIFLPAKKDALSIRPAANVGTAYYLKLILNDRMVNKIRGATKLDGAPDLA